MLRFLKWVGNSFEKIFWRNVLLYDVIKDMACSGKISQIYYIGLTVTNWIIWFPLCTGTPGHNRLQSTKTLVFINALANICFVFSCWTWELIKEVFLFLKKQIMLSVLKWVGSSFQRSFAEIYNYMMSSMIWHALERFHKLDSSISVTIFIWFIKNV